MCETVMERRTRISAKMESIQKLVTSRSNVFNFAKIRRYLDCARSFLITTNRIAVKTLFSYTSSGHHLLMYCNAMINVLYSTLKSVLVSGSKFSLTQYFIQLHVRKVQEKHRQHR